MGHNRRQMNKGFSLIELIVTIAIMAVVTSASVGIYSLIGNSNFKEAYKSVTDALSKTRTETVSKGGKYAMVMKYDSSKGKTTIEVISDYTASGSSAPTYAAGDVIDSKDISKATFSVVEKASGATNTLNGSKVVWIEYSVSGVFKNACIYNGSSSTDIKEIDVSYGSKYSRRIKLSLSTGKFTEQ